MCSKVSGGVRTDHSILGVERYSELSAIAASMIAGPKIHRQAVETRSAFWNKSFGYTE
jgi:hypothetical protein